MIFIGAVSLFGDLRPSINFLRPNRRTHLKTTCSNWDLFLPLLLLCIRGQQNALKFTNYVHGCRLVSS